MMKLLPHARQIMQGVVLTIVLGFSAMQAKAEEATAVAQDHSGEIAVIGQILNQTQAEDSPQPSESLPNQSTSSKVLTGDEQSPNLPELNHPIIDPNQLLSAAEQAELSQKILSIYQTGKAQIGVVMVPSTGQQDIFSYSLKIAEDWGLGSEKYDNGLLIVVAQNDRKIQILTGYGLEGVLPDIMVNRIIRNQITPHFKNNQYGLGLVAGLDEIDRILSLDPELAKQAADQLREQQDSIQKEAEARQSSISRAFLILIIAVFASSIFGRKLAGIGAGVAGVVSGLVAGSGIIMSLIMGLVLFFLIISSVAQGIAHIATSSRGGGFGGGRGGGGFSGGGGGFGGGGASGSW